MAFVHYDITVTITIICSIPIVVVTALFILWQYNLSDVDLTQFYEQPDAKKICSNQRNRRKSQSGKRKTHTTLASETDSYGGNKDGGQSKQSKRERTIKTSQRNGSVGYRMFYNLYNANYSYLANYHHTNTRYFDERLTNGVISTLIYSLPLLIC